METPSHSLGRQHPLIQHSPLERLARDERASSISRISTQPIALAAAILIVLLGSVASIAAWRAFTGNSPELDRVAAARQLQARATQASEQLVEKTKGLEATQQESVDQLQVVQDQLQTVRRLLAAQQTDSKRLSEQVSALTEAIEGLRQSFASAQTSDPAPSGVRNRSIRRAVGHYRRSRPHS
jgi:flagellar motility protein MotE (MotC chaperone)